MASSSTAPPDLAATPVPWFERLLVVLFVVVPFLAVLAAVPFAWGWGLTWRDVVIAGVMYLITGFGITVGYHRHFTHRSFQAKTWLRVVMAIAGGMSLQGPVIRWVADHRRHHKYADREGDPHSPWRFGPGFVGLSKGLFHAHVGWLFSPERTSRRRFCPDLLADRPIRFLSHNLAYVPVVLLSLGLPTLVGGLWGGSWHAALTAYFWGGLVRIFLQHHVTWSINSICHTFGKEEFTVRDRSRNVWWLALISLGEAWHNLHHADPTCARHGVLRGQIDPSARLIWLFERFGWAWDVRWPDTERLAARRVNAMA
ncbi:acyl-CoA desaturase [Planobispora longispora]|uniref:Stearoyl-CoA desaturase n=1 Tax=Planobispora longispora TaxID=28887 RepID=A0A8J3RTM3_9ACTN|nr:acyl-CoA desaturase [Planobispora longispora]BFE88563.1 acyl-CoA desaturase [Planobispora longispora]GIH81135.1 stearoyl-CoA desaturase [Planobispora longispora]